MSDEKVDEDGIETLTPYEELVTKGQAASTYPEYLRIKAKRARIEAQRSLALDKVREDRDALRARCAEQEREIARLRSWLAALHPEHGECV